MVALDSFSHCSTQGQPNLIVSLSACCNKISIPTSEYKALEDLYSATNGSNWYPNGQARWNFTGTHDPCCEGWQGVTCQCSEVLFWNIKRILLPVNIRRKQIVCNILTLDLDSTNLIGSVPESIGDLSSMQTLKLPSNLLSGLS